jgi:hypothetical protein
MKAFARLERDLRDFCADIRFLVSREIAPTFVDPGRGTYGDAGSYQSAIREMRRLHKFAIVRAAVKKHEIRESLGLRFWKIWFLASPITFPFCLVIELRWIDCLMANPHIEDWFSMTYWYYTIRQGWL